MYPNLVPYPVAALLAPAKGIVMLLRRLQPENAELPILVTLEGIVISVRPVQLEKAELPILVKLAGIVIPVRPVHPEKAESPILAIWLFCPNVTPINSVQFWKA